MNPQDFFQKKGEQLAASGTDLASINSTYQFSISGDGGGDWVIELNADKQEVRTGVDESAQCVISMTSEDFMGMIGGTLNPQMAFMTGKLRVKGDMGLALKLQSVLA
jgi:putative sterol carrier protein